MSHDHQYADQVNSEELVNRYYRGPSMSPYTASLAYQDPVCTSPDVQQLGPADQRAYSYNHLPHTTMTTQPHEPPLLAVLAAKLGHPGQSLGYQNMTLDQNLQYLDQNVQYLDQNMQYLERESRLRHLHTTLPYHHARHLVPSPFLFPTFPATNGNSAHNRLQHHPYFQAHPRQHDRLAQNGLRFRSTHASLLNTHQI